MNDRFDDPYRDLSWPGWNLAFDRDRHLALCAGQLDILRQALGAQWPLLGKQGVRKAGLAEAKVLAKHIIRVASKSLFRRFR